LSDRPLEIKAFADLDYQENAYVIATQTDASNPVGWIIDPGFPPQVQQVLEYVSGRGITIEKILLTHGHIDHIAGLDPAHQAHPEAKVWMPAAEQCMLEDAQANLSAPFGMGITVETRADADLSPGLELSLGRFTWRVFDTSGHSPAGRSLYCQEAGVVIAGDALFAGSIGRTDLPGSSQEQLISHIRENLLVLPDDTIVHSGHGPSTTIGIERKSNPFVSDG